MDDRAEIQRHILGLPGDATAGEMKARADALLDWLGSRSVPDSLRPWADAQRDLIREIGESLGDSVAQTPAPRPHAASDPGTARGRRGRGLPSLRTILRSPVTPITLAVVVAVAIVGWVLWGGPASDAGPAASPGQPAGPAQILEAQRARLTELEVAVALDPSDRAALFELGETHIQADDWEGAIFWFSKLLEADPTNVHALVDVGYASMSLGRVIEAEAAFLQALELDPDDARAHYNTGFLMAFAQDTPDVDQAVTHWSEVIRLDPESELAEIAQAHIDESTGLAEPGETGNGKPSGEEPTPEPAP